MNKPDITEGEWRPVHIKERENEDGFIMPEEYYVSEGVNWICKLIHGRKENYPANANAISAVPDMIDALMHTYRINNQTKEPTEKEYKEWFGKIEQTLEKAGVKFDE